MDKCAEIVGYLPSTRDELRDGFYLPNFSYAWIWNPIYGSIDSKKGNEDMEIDVKKVKEINWLGRRFVREDVFPIPQIERVIYSGPATIVLWSDDTKTVVKCQEGDTWDPEKGVLGCVAKKAFGNKSNYNNVIQKAVTQGIKDCE